MSLIRNCPACGNPLPPDAPASLCPVCLLKTDSAANPPSKGPSGEPTTTLTIAPEAFTRVRYFGDYELREEIARGGMGVVWKARQSSLNRTVALKMILAGKLAGEAEVQRFRREAEAAANLQHPNIVAIHEVGEHDGQHYYSMDYVEGRDLGALARETGPLPPARAAECLRTIAEAVHFAHQRGTLHRDLKPQNVLMDAAGVPHITDFGLAKFLEHDDGLTKTGAAMGSPSYMPPEQAAGHLDQIGPHSDIYALGAILYELLTGRPPFRAETAMATMRQVMESDPVAPRKVNPVVPPDLETICLKCLEKNPGRRYPSAQALAEDLGRFLKHEPIQALPVSAVRKGESWVRRHPWTLMAAGSLVIMVLTGTLYWQYERVKFLEMVPLRTDQALLHPGPRGQELHPWWSINVLLYMMNMWAMLVYRRLAFQGFARGMNNGKQTFFGSTDIGPNRPVSQRLRVICVLLSVAGFGCAAVNFAEIIKASVWGGAPRWYEWGIVYAGFYFSVALLAMVVREYQAFIHGAPIRTLPAEQSETLRQVIFDGDIQSAVKLYRGAIPGVSSEEAVDYVRRLEAELKAKQPGKFAPPPKMSHIALAVIVLLVLIGFRNLLVVSGPFSCAAGFILGASMMLSYRLKGFWNQRQAQGAVFGCFLTFFLVPTLQSPGKATMFLFGGAALGVCTIVFGFPRKPRKPAPSEQRATDVSPPL